MFNVVDDPLERGNLKGRHKDIYDRIVAEWQAWNASMLPEIDESFTESYTGAQLGDQKPSGAPDPAPWRSVLIMCTGGAERPILHDRHFSAASSFHIGVSRAGDVGKR